MVDQIHFIENILQIMVWEILFDKIFGWRNSSTDTRTCIVFLFFHKLQPSSYLAQNSEVSSCLAELTTIHLQQWGKVLNITHKQQWGKVLNTIHIQQRGKVLNTTLKKGTMSDSYFLLLYCKNVWQGIGALYLPFACALCITNNKKRLGTSLHKYAQASHAHLSISSRKMRRCNSIYLFQ